MSVSSEFIITSSATSPDNSKGNSVKKTKATRKRASILTDDQKKKHHIESEHKRRQAIREAFDKLVDIVPGLEASDSRSEVLILTKSGEYLTKLYQDHVELMEKAESLSIEVSEDLKLKVPSVVEKR